MADDYRWKHEDARALTEAGYMPLEEYLRLCRESGWLQKTDNLTPVPPDRTAASPQPCGRRGTDGL
jgi:hypothetical protein